MFAAPSAGWSFMTVNNIPIGSISYIEDVPNEFCNECIRYLKDDNNDTANRLFNISFDAEGYDIGITQIGEWDFFAFDTRDITKNNKENFILTNLKQINTKDNLYPKDFVYEMLKEAINDFTTDFDIWANDWYYDKAEINTFIETIEKAKETIKEYEKTTNNRHEMELGNLIFGNSRGDFPIPDRESWQNAFWDYFGDILDYHAYYENHKKDPNHTTDRGGYENETFLINPYYWGEDEEIAELPNFIYKPTGFEIQWYKYPLRDSYMNQNISLEEAKEIWKNCIESM